MESAGLPATIVPVDEVPRDGSKSAFVEKIRTLVKPVLCISLITFWSHYFSVLLAATPLFAYSIGRGLVRGTSFYIGLRLGVVGASDGLVTVGMTLLRRIGIWQGIALFTFQIVSAIAGAMLAVLLLPSLDVTMAQLKPKYQFETWETTESNIVFDPTLLSHPDGTRPKYPAYLGYPKILTSSSSAFLIEGSISFIVYLIIFYVTVARRTSATKGAASVGVAVGLTALTFANYTGAGINPLYVLASSLARGHPFQAGWWIYWMASSISVVCAALFSNFILQGENPQSLIDNYKIDILPGQSDKSGISIKDSESKVGGVGLTGPAGPIIM